MEPANTLYSLIQPSALQLLSFYPVFFSVNPIHIVLERIFSDSKPHYPLSPTRTDLPVSEPAFHYASLDTRTIGFHLCRGLPAPSLPMQPLALLDCKLQCLLIGWKAATVTAAFLEFRVYPCDAPRCTLTITGKQLVAKFFDSVCRILGSKQYLSAAYHPQTRG